MSAPSSVRSVTRRSISRTPSARRSSQSALPPGRTVPRRRGPSKSPAAQGGGPASTVGHGADVLRRRDIHVQHHQQTRVHGNVLSSRGRSAGRKEIVCSIVDTDNGVRPYTFTCDSDLPSLPLHLRDARAGSRREMLFHLRRVRSSMERGGLDRGSTPRHCPAGRWPIPPASHLAPPCIVMPRRWRGR